jgi:hypothetical protein
MQAERRSVIRAKSLVLDLLCRDDFSAGNTFTPRPMADTDGFGEDERQATLVDPLLDQSPKRPIA